jgi:hypothetical protein
MVRVFKLLIVLVCLVGLQGCGKTDKSTSGGEKKGHLYTMEFPEKLEKGEAYSSTFIHPMTKEVLKREIVGMEGDKCVYIEEMPNDGKMICKFSESERKAAAQYYRDMLTAKTSRTKVNLSSSENKVKAKYYINGKEVDNPLQEAVNSGSCVVEGY